ncbi:hypothetical protein EPO56_03875 [Patescibacteria group bacterium]|nr:MAG: hypothetical protein EPO56_03875 [Patescibacteria group bacterium]
MVKRDMEGGEKRQDYSVRNARNPLTAIAFAIGLGVFVPSAEAQSRPSNYNGWDLTEEQLRTCVRLDQREWNALRNGRMPNLGNVCGGDQALSSAADQFFARQRAAETPAERRDREKREARELEELCRLHPDNCL